MICFPTALVRCSRQRVPVKDMTHRLNIVLFELRHTRNDALGCIQGNGGGIVSGETIGRETIHADQPCGQDARGSRSQHRSHRRRTSRIAQAGEAASHTRDRGDSNSVVLKRKTAVCSTGFWPGTATPENNQAAAHLLVFQIHAPRALDEASMAAMAPIRFQSRPHPMKVMAGSTGQSWQLCWPHWVLESSAPWNPCSVRSEVSVRWL
jgi:hypothetical protein